MLHHVSINVGDFAKAKDFYSKALAPLGYALISEFPEWSVAGFGEQGKPDTWIHAKGAEVLEKMHVAYATTSKDAVKAFYDAALLAGGTDNGAPGYRKEYSPGYYAAFIYDLNGHNIEAVFMDPNPSE